MGRPAKLPITSPLTVKSATRIKSSTDDFLSGVGAPAWEESMADPAAGSRSASRVILEMRNITKTFP
ncbi:hypothetical protein, partial [Pleomorphomonas diazotrophica]|uniref:hypothetical protein n=1 Tax=Pleomorphomonas diazotrophica TaxID=1166257 RepID=UPI001AEED6BD